MLTKQECRTLNAIRHNCYGYGVSPTDASFGVIRGRPRGGVGFLWKKHLNKHISIIDCEFDWICGIQINIGVNRDYYLLNVYLPYECEDHRNVFNDYLAKLNVVVLNINSTCITILGDFNSNIARRSLLGDILQTFCVDLMI